MINCCKNNKHKLLIMLLYSSGLRVSECLKLKFEDLDFNNKIGLIKQGKGKKDRYFILSTTFLMSLKSYIKEQERDQGYIFLGKNRYHLSVAAAQKIVRRAAGRAGIKKQVHPHALRACFATHLLEQGEDIYSISQLMGHSKIKTTEGYLRYSPKNIIGKKSPLDLKKKESLRR